MKFETTAVKFVYLSSEIDVYFSEVIGQQPKGNIGPAAILKINHRVEIISKFKGGTFYQNIFRNITLDRVKCFLQVLHTCNWHE